MGVDFRFTDILTDTLVLRWLERVVSIHSYLCSRHRAAPPSASKLTAGGCTDGRRSDDDDDDYDDNLVRVGVIELVLGQGKLRTDHYRTATSQIFEKLWQDRGPAASVLPKCEIQLEGGYCRGIGFHGGDPSAVVRLVLELDVDRAAADAARFLLGQFEHLRSYPGQKVGRE